MSSRKKCIILVSVLVVILIVIGVIIYIGSNGKKIETLLIGSGNTNNEEENKEDDTINSDGVLDIDDNVDISDNYDNLDNDEINNSDQDESSTSDYEYTEDDVVEYFSSMEEEVTESSSFKEKFKEYFITVVDFIFYDKRVMGYTFSELSSSAKAKIISVALKIDSKIEEYIPNYKESISSTGSKIYTNVKEKLVTLYMDIATDICKDNEKECTNVKEIFSDIKDYCKIGWDFIKKLASSGVSKVKEWYEIYSGK